MPRTVYIEEDIASHPRTREVLARHPNARRVTCRRYGEIFNGKNQNFRIQKQQPALILARKHDRHVLATPPVYGLDGRHHYYFSHMLNCVYDCRYCFLQGMYRSAHHVLFINYEDFMTAIDACLAGHAGETVWFYSGYDGDSLACEPMTGFARAFLPFFRQRPQARLELRTKSTQIRTLLEQPALPNCVVAFSFTPAAVSASLEHGVPDVSKRIQAMRQLQEHGWHVGLRFDPLIDHHGYADHYRNLFAEIFAAINIERLHSVSLGSFRVPREYFRQMQRLYPEEKLFAGRMETRNGLTRYDDRRQQQLQSDCTDMLLGYIPEQKLFPCT